MFGRSMFTGMQQDDFFAGHREHMRQMELMMGDPFRGMGMLQDSSVNGRQQRDNQGQGSSNALSPFGQMPGFNFGNMFGNMGMMPNMDQAFVQASQNGNGHSFQQTSVMSYSKSGDGAPKVYQASTATKRGPGGVLETRKALHDSERELEKMSVGRHIYDRGHEIEKHRNTRSGQIEEMQNYHNIDEREAEAFNHEWQGKAKTAFRGVEYSDRPAGRRGGERRELRDRSRDHDRRRDNRRERRQQLALPEPTSSPTGKSEHWGRPADESGRDRS